MNTKSNRRQLLLGAGGAAAGLLCLPDSRTAFGYRANEQFNVAVVGMAGYGAYHYFAGGIHRFSNVGYTISCDVDRRKVQRVYDLWKQRSDEWANSEHPAEREAARQHYRRLAARPPELFTDFRRMLDEADHNIDAVVVATPDHTHALIAAAALRAGKPVLCEKPLTIASHEARALRQLARESGLPTQMNNQGASTPGFLRGVEIIRDGIIGPVQQVHVFFSRGGRGFQQTPQGSRPVPSELDWDLWLAQLSWRDYHPDWINRIAWRESSLGELGNFGPHSANMAFLALNVTDLWNAPDSSSIRIDSTVSEVNQLSYPKWERIRWQVPARNNLPPVTFTWHHGAPPDYSPGSRELLSQLLRDHGATDKDLETLLPYAGSLIVGSKGLLATNSHNTSVMLLPRSRFEDIEQRKPLHLPLSPGHDFQWIEACRGGNSKPISNFEYSAPFAEFLNVGSLSTRFPDVVLEFDPRSGRVLNHPEADARLHYPYRDGWTI